MALYAIGDIHLTFHSDKDMSVFGEVWRNHEEKFLKNYTEIITPDDTVVFTGDHTWGGHLSTCRPDLDWICELPGRKILLRGNHDIFWQIKKTRRLMEEYRDRLYFLQDNFWSYGEYALVGSKGYCYEPWDNNERALELAAERYRREEKRVRKSFEVAKAAGYEKFILFLHYPPTEIESSGNEFGGNPDSCFTRLAKEYGAGMVVYSHLHGEERFNDSLMGVHEGVEYRLVSGDYLGFRPVKLMD